MIYKIFFETWQLQNFTNSIVDCAGALCSACSQFGHRLRGPSIVLGCTFSLKSAMMNHWTTSKNRKVLDSFIQYCTFTYQLVWTIGSVLLIQRFWNKIRHQPRQFDVRMPGPSSHSFHQQVQQAWGTVLKAHPFFSWDKKSWGRRIIPNGLGEGCKGKNKPARLRFEDPTKKMFVPPKNTCCSWKTWWLHEIALDYYIISHYSILYRGIYLHRSHLHLPAILALAHSHVHSTQMSW